MLAARRMLAALREATASRLIAEHRVDELLAPCEQLGVAQRRSPEPGRRSGTGAQSTRAGATARAGSGVGLWRRYEHGTHRGLEQRPRVQALHPHLTRVR